MNDKKHTGRPWHWDEYADELVDRNGKSVLRCLFGSIEVSESNKKLIAAAPEMLEALINARQFISNGIQFGYIAKPEPGSPEAQTLGIIVDAIKKAEVRECEKS